MENFYAILNIDINASKQEIKKAYRVLAVKYHPDKNQGNDKLTQKFLEVKEAYETLIDPLSRQDYDIRFTASFHNAENQKTKENSFHENPFNSSTIEDDYTPQYKPSFDLFGEKAPENIIFFKLPKNIGVIIGAFSLLKEDDKPLSKEKKKSNIIKGVVVSIILYLLIFYIGNPSQNWSIFWFLAISIITAFLLDSINTFHFQNFFVGTNGFAHFEIRGTKDNITKEFEINFNEITDMYVHLTEVKKNLIYEKTEYEYIFINNGEKVYSESGSFKKDEEVEIHKVELNFCRKIEQSWNIYLLNTIEDKLKKDGCLTFHLYNYGNVKKYIKMGVGEITFIRDDKEFTYNYDDIKYVYRKGNDLFIEHINFERKFYFMKSGDADKIPLLDLCNRNFFLKSFEILIGYSL
ncbi:hypothetical protein ERX46_05390 [Brumimicrobium glaciale]|uniref:J domain-containing protein n=1 Tax=Brumimicrobium glaciale TaxID=200475 RepID=A0A4Q4KS07_9FLAO|nr:J domain-containing protein [Brumimicrobium glaciale]RYM34809.1 hypothetical protein ERX46_05390 [Brumimicrobium glaciale]